MTNDYVGKICPFCKTEFRESDDIVVCDSCDMPHHTDCWIENQGCTTFGCVGTMNSIEKPSVLIAEDSMDFGKTNETDMVYCTQCGARNASTSLFCFRCGSKIMPVPSQTLASEQLNHAVRTPNHYVGSFNNSSYDFDRKENYSQQGESSCEDEMLSILVGPQHEYYISKFQQMRMRNKKVSWNWPACFVAPYWFMYRKMYGHVIALLCIRLFLALLGGPIATYLIIGNNVVTGIFANYLYMKQLEEKLRRANLMSDTDRMQFITKRGGVNVWLPVVLGVGYVVCSILVGLYS